MKMRNVPFSPKYIAFGFSAVIGGNMQTALSYKESDLEAYFKDSDFQNDLQRSAWIVINKQNNEVIINNNHGEFDCLESLGNDFAAKIHLHSDLSLEESKALVAFYSRQHSAKIVSGDTTSQQAGLWRISLDPIKRWLTSFSLGYDNQDEEPLRISKQSQNKDGKGEIKFVEIKSTLNLKNKLMNMGAGKIAKNDNVNELELDYRFRMTKENDTFNAELNSDQYTCSIREDIFQDFILKRAREKLADADTFTADFYKLNVYLLVACLSDGAFAKAFADKLSSLDDEVKVFAKLAVNACYDGSECTQILTVIDEAEKAYSQKLKMQRKQEVMKKASKMELERNVAGLFGPTLAMAIGAVMLVAVVNPLVAVILMAGLVVAGAVMGAYVYSQLKVNDSKVVNVLKTSSGSDDERIEGGDTRRMHSVLRVSTGSVSEDSSVKDVAPVADSSSPSDPSAALSAFSALSDQNNESQSFGRRII